MIHVDPAHPAFERLPRSQQARIYVRHGWTIEALMDEYGVVRKTVRTWLRPDGLEKSRESKRRSRERLRAARRQQRGE